MDNVYLAGLMDPRLHRSATPAISSAQPLPPTPAGLHHGLSPHMASWASHSPGSTGLPPHPGFPHMGGHGLGDPRHGGPGGPNPFFPFSLMDPHHHQRMAAESHRFNMAQVEAARMAEVQKALEDSRRKEAAAVRAAVTTSSFPLSASLSSLAASVSSTREPLFSHGLSPLDRGGLYPSPHHGGILDPLSTSIPPPLSLSSPKPGSSRHMMFAPYESGTASILRPTPSIPFRPFGLSDPPKSTSGSSMPVSLSGATSVVSTTGTMTSVMSADARGNPSKYPSGETNPDPEEVLVDDFDGQCCRTYPYNHSRIQRWQREHNEKRRLRKEVSAPPPAERGNDGGVSRDGNLAASGGNEKNGSRKNEHHHQSGMLSSSSAANRSASADGRRESSFASNLQRSTSEANILATTGSIPVGIAIGRQRQQESLDLKRAEELSRAASAPQGPPTCGPHGDKFGPMPSPSGMLPMGVRWPHPPAGPSMGWPPSPRGPPGAPSPSGFPPVPQWIPPGLTGAPSPMGPIPMGYQLAKDPLTGQILLIPTDVANNPPHGVWPPPQSPYDSPTSGMTHFTSLGPPPPTPPTSTSSAVAAAHFHHMYMHQQHQQHQQQQQHQHQMYMHQAAAAAHHAAAASKGMHRPLESASKRTEPETITVSDDEDEEPSPAKTTRSNADGTRRTEEIDDPNAAFDRLFDSVRPKPPEKEGPKFKSETAHHSVTVSATSPSCPSPAGASVKSASRPSPVAATDTSASPRPSPAAVSAPIVPKTENVARTTTRFDVMSLTSSSKSESEKVSSQSKQPNGEREIVPVIKTEPRTSIDSRAEEPLGESNEVICSKNLDITSKAPSGTVKTEPQDETGPLVSLDLSVPSKVEPACDEASVIWSQREEIARELAFFSENVRTFHEPDLRPKLDPEVVQPSFSLSGFEALLKGIDIKEGKGCAFDRGSSVAKGLAALCSITQNDLVPLGLRDKYFDLDKVNVDLLCHATANDFVHHQNWVDPLKVLEDSFNLHGYKCEESEATVKEFIANKIKQCPPTHPICQNLAIDGVNKDVALGLGTEQSAPEEDPYMGIKSLAKVIKQIKNSDFMSQTEIELRAKLGEIQSLYREKHKLLARLKMSTPRKGSAKGGTPSKRGPGRPKKRKLQSKGKNKMGRPRKTKLPSTESRYAEDEEELAPPILEPCAQPPTLALGAKARSRSSSVGSSKSKSGGHMLLKPPTLTASFSPQKTTTTTVGKAGFGGGVTNLSTISAKFMKGKANPFANLLSKLAPGGNSSGVSEQHSKAGSEDEDGPRHSSGEEQSEEEEFPEMNESETERSDEDNEEEEQAVRSDVRIPASPLSCGSTSQKRGSRRNSTPSNHSSSHKSSPVPCAKKDSDEEANSSSKKRKADKPRKHTGTSSETIVPKKPRNLFMMNCLNLQREFKSTSAAAATNSSVIRDEYDFTDDDDDEEEEDEEAARESSSHVLGSVVATPPVKSSPARPAALASNMFTEYLVSPQGAESSAPMAASSPVFNRGDNKPWREHKKSKHNTTPHKSSGGKSSSKERKHKSSFNESYTAKMSSPHQHQSSDATDLEYAVPSSSSGQTALRTATLKASDLTDGLRFLWLDNGRFHPARLNSTPLEDIYSVTMEKQRSNRPDIMPRDDVLNLGIFELRPLSKAQLPIGTRVCVYWSQAYNYLFPGTVELMEVPFKDSMVEVLLDDGDRRQVDLVNVRMLPPNYSHVVPAPDPLETRKRRISNDSVDAAHDLHLHQPRIQSLYQRKVSPSPGKKLKPGTPITTAHGKTNKKRHKHKHCSKRHKHYHKKAYPPPPAETIFEDKEEEEATEDDCDESGEEESDNLRIKLDGSFNNTTTYSIRSPMYQTRTTSEESNHGDDDMGEDSSDDSSDSETELESDKRTSRVGGINPVTGRPFWKWVEGDEGYRRPGKKGGKAKKLFHRAIQRDSETLNVGDCAVFLSTARVDRPYIGKVELLWETWNGNMMVKVKWFYHPEEIETSGKNYDLKVPGGLFQSPHTDENDVQTISHKCQVLPLKEYSRVLISDPVKRRKVYANSDTYYLAGSYDPTTMSVNFQPGVLK